MIRMWFLRLNSCAKCNFRVSMGKGRSSLSLSPPRLLLYKDRKVFKRGWIRGTSGRIQPSRNYVSSRDRFRASFVHDRSSTWPPLEPPLSVVDAARGGQDRYAPRARSRCRCYYRSFFSLRTSAVSCDFPRSIRCGQVRVSYFQYSSILVIRYPPTRSFY